MIKRPSETALSVSSVPDEKFGSCFVEILHRWQTGSTTVDDIKYLRGITMSEVDYVALTEQYALRHGIELVDYHIELLTYPTGLHEYMAYTVNIWMNDVYGREIMGLGSMSNLNSCCTLTFRLTLWQRPVKAT